ncbi:hypothetical protein O0I10_010174 [Lichtheimia ornata]|uniref:F-box domain-containing protein n=1 Tax=Lichtheimia ornata TaxID=688661 RepID=A0AAD7UV24_9FUNG|nr:uncharacterized protein O0I10_010174 [Lichtheimia ornata]KAJ8654099.1 hypothetical protein O0I10_010174 [Lichtheimia ornata]
MNDDNSNVLDIHVPPRPAFNVDTLQEQIGVLDVYSETRNHGGALTSVDAMIAMVQNDILTTTCLERALARALGGDTAAALKEIDVVIQQQPTLVKAYIYAIRIACLNDLRRGWLYYHQGNDKVARHVPEFDTFSMIGEALAATIMKQNSWRLPYDVVATIVELLSFDDRINFAHTCTYWKDFILTCPQAWRRLHFKPGTETKWGAWLKKHSATMEPYIRHVIIGDQQVFSNFVIHMNHLETLEISDLPKDMGWFYGDNIWRDGVIRDFFNTRVPRKKKQLESFRTSGVSRIIHRSISDILTLNPELKTLSVVTGSYAQREHHPSIAIKTAATLFLRELSILYADPDAQGLASILERSPNLESLVYITKARHPQSFEILHSKCEHVASTINKHCPRIKSLCYLRDDVSCWNTFAKEAAAGQDILAYYDMSDTKAEDHLLDFAKRHQDTLKAIIIDLKYTLPTSYFVHFLLHTTLPRLTSLYIRGRFESTASLATADTRFYLSYSKVANMIQRHSKLRHVRLEKACELEKPVLQAISRLNQLEEVSLGFFYVSLADRMDDLSMLLDKTQATLKRFHLHVGISNLNTHHIFNLVDKYDQLTHLTCGTNLNLMLDGITDFVRMGSSTFSPPKRSRQLTSLRLLAPSGNLNYMAFEPISDLALLPNLKNLEITHMAGQRLSATLMGALVRPRPDLTARVTSGGQVYIYPSTADPFV